MQVEGGDLGHGHPDRFEGLLTGGMHTVLGACERQYGVVGPADVIIVEDSVDPDGAGRYRALFRRLAQGRGDGRFVAVHGPAGQPPGTAMMAPPAAPPTAGRLPGKP